MTQTQAEIDYSKRPATAATRAALLARVPDRYRQDADQVGPVEVTGRAYNVKSFLEKRGTPLVTVERQDVPVREQTRKRRQYEPMPDVTEIDLDEPEKSIRIKLGGKFYTLGLVEPELVGGATMLYLEGMIGRRMEKLNSAELDEAHAEQIAQELGDLQMKQIIGLIPSLTDPENAPILHRMRPSVFRKLQAAAQQYVIEAFGNGQESNEDGDEGGTSDGAPDRGN